MRTVLLHLRNTNQADVAQFLQATYPCQAGPPWIVEVGGDACLYINFYLDAETEFEPDDFAELCRFLAGAPSVSLAADVSGRHAGDEQVRDFVSTVLTRFDGRAQDEWTRHLWRLDEIRARHRVQERQFFDHG
jgi:hypothetical protein